MGSTPSSFYSYCRTCNVICVTDISFSSLYSYTSSSNSICFNKLQLQKSHGIKRWRESNKKIMKIKQKKLVHNNKQNIRIWILILHKIFPELFLKSILFYFFLSDCKSKVTWKKNVTALFQFDVSCGPRHKTNNNKVRLSWIRLSLCSPNNKNIDQAIGGEFQLTEVLAK